MSNILKMADVTPHIWVEGENESKNPKLCSSVLYDEDGSCVLTIVNPSYEEREEIIKIPDVSVAECIYGTQPQSVEVRDGVLCVTVKLMRFGTTVIKCN